MRGGGEEQEEREKQEGKKEEHDFEEHVDYEGKPVLDSEGNQLFEVAQASLQITPFNNWYVPHEHDTEFEDANANISIAKNEKRFASTLASHVYQQIYEGD